MVASNHLHRNVRATLVVLSMALASVPTFAQQDKNAERAARRLQLQMQNLQQRVEEAQSAKAKADAEKAIVEQQLAAQVRELPRAQGALRKANESLKVSESERAELSARVAALEKQLNEQKRAANAALGAKDDELAASSKKRDALQAQLQLRYDEKTRQAAACTDKNERLVELSAELLDRYRRKGLVDALKQRDPLLGLSDVQMFNLVQDYRDKIDAQRYSPPPDSKPQSP